MKFSIRIALLLALCLLPTWTFGADTAEAQWQGQIEIPGSSLDIVVNLGQDKKGQWQGAIDIPAQGLKGFALEKIAVDGSQVTFTIPGVPGEPTFKGELSEDGGQIKGQFTQGTAAFPFTLKRSGEAKFKAPLPAAKAINKEMSAALAGRWLGTLKPPGREINLVLVLKPDASNGLTATLDFPDMGKTGIPVSRLTLEGSILRAEIGNGAAAFEGTLNENLTVAKGTWTEGPGNIPLTLTKETVGTDHPFPKADPDSVGMSAKALSILDERVKALVTAENIVGGEMLVIKNRRTVFQKAYGWKDKEDKKNLEVDAVYCVRSMTKPFVGTAIQMLIDEGKLELNTPVKDILPFFDNPRTGQITVNHLLTHTGGFPFTTISKPLADYKDLGAVAEEAASLELLFEPGSQFEYSDAGSDTLGAMIEKITGAPVDQFIQKRILDPLKMGDTTTLLGDKGKVKARIPSAYSGGTGQWSKHWSPTDKPMFPFFLTSQSLFSTTTDYARFLAFWMDGGKVGDKALLSPEAVQRGLAAHMPMNYPHGFKDVDVFYGQQWMVYSRSGAKVSPDPVVFGHNGSDGTYAWAWPELDLMVLFFTQSRGTLAGTGLEAVLQALVVDQNLDDPALMARVPSKEELSKAAGMYWDETNPTGYYIVTPRGNDLTVERPGSLNAIFKADATPGRFVHEAAAQVFVEFLPGKDGTIQSMRYFFGGQIETGPRHTSVKDLPSVEQVVAMVQKAHGIQNLKKTGGMRMSGTLKFLDRKMEGTVSVLYDGLRERTEVNIGSAKEVVVTGDGMVWTENSNTGFAQLEGQRKVQALLGRLSIRFGDWRKHYQSVEVLKRIEKGENRVLLVRVVPKDAPGATLFIDEKTGRVRRTDSFVMLPGMGQVGVSNQFEDFREVDGMLLPFRSTSKYASKLIGRVVTQMDTFETGVKMAKDAFTPPAAKK